MSNPVPEPRRDRGLWLSAAAGVGRSLLFCDGSLRYSFGSLGHGSRDGSGRTTLWMPSSNRCIPNPRIGKFRISESATYSRAGSEVFRTHHKRTLQRGVGCSSPIGLSACAARPIALRIPPQPDEGVRESCWRLGRGERLAKFVQGHSSRSCGSAIAGCCSRFSGNE
jgi:hypothetical protein